MYIYQISIYNLAATGSSLNISQKWNGIYTTKQILLKSDIYNLEELKLASAYIYFNISFYNKKKHPSISPRAFKLY